MEEREEAVASRQLVVCSLTHSTVPVKQDTAKPFLSLCTQEEGGQREEQRSEDSVFTQLFAECAEDGWAPVDRLIGYIRSVLPGSKPASSREEVFDSDGSVSEVVTRGGEDNMACLLFPTEPGGGVQPGPPAAYDGGELH